MIETIVENPRSAEESTSKDDVMDDDRYEGLRYMKASSSTSSTTDRAHDDEGSSCDQRVGVTLDTNANESDKMTMISD